MLWLIDEFVLVQPKSGHFFFFLIYLFNLIIFGCIGSLLLHVGFSLVEASGSYSVVVRGLLIAVASLVVEHGL